MSDTFKRRSALFWGIFIQTAVVTFNFRAIAQLRYLDAFVSDIGYFLLAFFNTQRVARSENRLDSVIYAVGGAAGATLSMYLTKLYFGK